MTEEKLILSLIKDDLINAKLMNGLSELGINADNYYLHLSSTIFKLMGFEDTAETEVIYERYLELSKAMKFIDIDKSQEQIDKLALLIYNELSSNRTA